MSAIEHMMKAEIRKLARQGKLIDTAFKMFRANVYPGATPDQIAALRVAFFAGAAELFAVMSSGMDDGLSETEGDLAFMAQWVEELETFHRNTIAASGAGGTSQ